MLLIRDFSVKTYRALLPSRLHLLPAPPSPLFSLVVHIPITAKNLPETIISPGKRVRTDCKRGQVRVYFGEASNSSGDTVIEMAQKGSFPSLSFVSAGVVSSRGELWGTF